MEVNKNNSKPWKLHGTYDTYEEASLVKTGLLELDSDLQAKIRRRYSKNKFSLKTRVLSAPVEEKPKSGKSKRLQFDEMREERLSEDKKSQLKLLLD